MAAFTPLSLLTSALPMVSATPATPAESLAAAQRAEQIRRSEVQQAQTAAALDQHLAAQEAEARLAEDARRADVAAEEASTAESLALSDQARQDTLARAQARERARQAASGLAGGGTARVLLRGLAEDAGKDRAAEEAVARQRLDDIRRQTETARRKDLLDLAESRRRAALTRHSAATATDFVRRSAALAEAADAVGQGARTSPMQSLGNALYGSVGQLFQRG